MHTQAEVTFQPLAILPHHISLCTVVVIFISSKAHNTKAALQTSWPWISLSGDESTWISLLIFLLRLSGFFFFFFPLCGNSGWHLLHPFQKPLFFCFSEHGVFLSVLEGLLELPFPFSSVSVRNQLVYGVRAEGSLFSH